MVDCNICLDRKDGKEVVIAGHTVCADCFSQEYVPRFHRALAYESHYPVRWGEVVDLDPHDYSDFFDDSDDFIRKWETKEKEYEALPKDRVYCSSCKAFMGQKPKEDEVGVTRSCDGCSNTTYVCCGVEGIPDAAEDHICVEEDESAFEGLVLDANWQICPNPKCQTPIELLDACNAVRCPHSACRTPFCIVCGQECDEDSGHWDEGGTCPRWGVPNTKSAIFDRPETPEIPDTPQPPMVEGTFGAQAMELPRGYTRVTWHSFAAEGWIEAVYPWTDRSVLNARINEVADLILQEPAIPVQPDMTASERLDAEMFAKVVRDGGPLGALQRRHLQLLREVQEHLEDMVDDHRANNMPLPVFLQTVLQVIEPLRQMLRFYVERVVLTPHLDAIDESAALEAHNNEWRRQDVDVTLLLLDEDFVPIVQHFPGLYHVFVPYFAAKYLLRDYVELASQMLVHSRAGREDIAVIPRRRQQGR